MPLVRPHLFWDNFKLTCKLYTKGIRLFVIKICSMFNTDLSTVLFCTMQSCKWNTSMCKAELNSQGYSVVIYFPRNAGQEDDNSSCNCSKQDVMENLRDPLKLIWNSCLSPAQKSPVSFLYSLVYFYLDSLGASGVMIPKCTASLIIILKTCKVRLLP